MSESFSERYVRARRAVIASQFANLNEMQRQAVLTTEGPLLILAGAGSGKTTVLINRVTNLMRYGRGADSSALPAGACEADLAVLEAGPSPEALRLAALDPVEPWRILAITFTNKAADELKNRLESMLGPQALDVWASTFHSACVRILRRDADKLGYPTGFSIYDTADSQSVIKRALRALNLDEKQFPHKAVLSAISRAKDEGKDAAAYAAMAQASGDFRLKKIAQVYELYARRLREAGAMDFDDLIFLTVRLLEEHEDVRAFYRRKFRYVLIDEYQDTNQLQYRLAALLTGEQGNICVVGDDDQSIYKFRGATIENILSFERQFAGARVIRLEQNYRSTGHILAAANAVISHNTGRKGKQLWTDQGDGDAVSLYTADNESDEARFAASTIMDAVAAGAAFRDHAVLYRMNAQSNQFEYAFKRAGVPYRIIGGIRFYDRAEVKDLLSYLHVVRNPADDERLLRIINTPARGIGQTTVETARTLAAAEDVPLFEVVSHAGQYPELARAGGKLLQFADLIVQLRELAALLPADELYDRVLELSGYVAALEKKGGEEAENRLENIRELKTNIAAFISQSEDGSLGAFLDEVALYTDIDNYDKSADCAVLMTMHAAKGLEFPTVFLAGSEEGLFPGMRAIGEPEEMEEERRLCYVGMTRAKRRLYLTCARQRMLFGRTTANHVSRFVEEIPAEHLVKTGSTWERRPAPTAEQRRAASRPAPAAHAVRPPVSPVITPDTAAPFAADFHVGDRVEHKAFGCGVVAAVTPVGRDYLAEVRFDKVGVKRMMLRVAAQHMKKL